MAVRNEERAFAFWSYVAAHAEVAEVRQAAETMAHEELGHVSILRRERRNAFHAERRSGGFLHSGGSVRSRRRWSGGSPTCSNPSRPRTPPQNRDRLSRVSWKRRADMRMSSNRPQSTWRVAAQSSRATPLALAGLLTDRYLDTGDGLRDEEAPGAGSGAGRARHRAPCLAEVGPAGVAGRNGAGSDLSQGPTVTVPSRVACSKSLMRIETFACHGPASGHRGRASTSQAFRSDLTA